MDNLLQLQDIFTDNYSLNKPLVGTIWASVIMFFIIYNTTMGLYFGTPYRYYSFYAISFFHVFKEK